MDSASSEPEGWLEVLRLKCAEEVRSGEEPEATVDAVLRVDGVVDQGEEPLVGVTPSVIDGSFEGDVLPVEENQGVGSNKQLCLSDPFNTLCY